MDITRLVFILISFVFLINVIISNIIFNKVKKLEQYFFNSKEGNFNKYYFLGIFYIFKIREMVEFEIYQYYKISLDNIYKNRSPIHPPLEKIREIKNNIKIYERRIKLEKIKKKTKLNIPKRIYS